MYDPATSRWLSMDPIGINLANPATYNKYAYVWNNPICLIDPLGLSPDLGPVEIPGATVTVTNYKGQVGIIQTVYKYGNDYYIDFFQALEAYGIMGQKPGRSGTVQSPNKMRYADFSFSGSKVEYSIKTRSLSWDPVIGKYYYTDIQGSQSSPLHLVDINYFHSLMCATGWGLRGKGPNVNLPTTLSNDYKALAEQFGKKTYSSRDQLL